MRIAFNFMALSAAVLIAPFIHGSISVAHAADGQSPPSLQSLNSNAGNAGSMPAAMPALMPPPAPSMGIEPAKNQASGLAAAENKIPDSVKDVMKRLDKPAEDVTLDDLNSARQAVAKIEILIDIEKHLAELDKIRRERDKEPNVASMIPASALQAPLYAAAPMNSMQPPVMAPRAESAEITQISGGNGRYNATLKTSGEDSKVVQTGDHLADGSVVVSIAPTEVVLERDGTKHTLHIKNVNTVFGNSF